MEDRERRDAAYEDDVYGWSLRQAELLRAGHYDDVDMDNVAEEIDVRNVFTILEAKTHFPEILGLAIGSA